MYVPWHRYGRKHAHNADNNHQLHQGKAFGAKASSLEAAQEF
jgi:hypothetical protein